MGHAKQGKHVWVTIHQLRTSDLERYHEADDVMWENNMNKHGLNTKLKLDHVKMSHANRRRVKPQPEVKGSGRSETISEDPQASL